MRSMQKILLGTPDESSNLDPSILMMLMKVEKQNTCINNLKLNLKKVE